MSLANCVIRFFIMKLILKITEAECMILENTSIYILVTNVALGPGMLKKAWNTEKTIEM